LWWDAARDKAAKKYRVKFKSQHEYSDERISPRDSPCIIQLSLGRVDRDYNAAVATISKKNANAAANAVFRGVTRGRSCAIC